jgi:hypothetical protein
MIKHPEQDHETCKSHILEAFLKKLTLKHREKYGQQLDVVYDYIISKNWDTLPEAIPKWVSIKDQVLAEKRAIHFRSMLRKALGKLRREAYNKEVEKVTEIVSLVSKYIDVICKKSELNKQKKLSSQNV